VVVAVGQRVPALLLAAVVLAGCNSGGITGIEHVEWPVNDYLSPDVKHELREENKIKLGETDEFRVSGQGVCGRIRVDFGDGASTELANADFSHDVQVSHSYTGWGGPKTIRAETVENCIGQASNAIHVEPEMKRFGIQMPGSGTACTIAPNVPPVRAGSVVRIDAIGSPPPQARFGCVGGICNWQGIDGSQTIAGSSFPFPGMREYSLVLRIGTKAYQGGDGASFVADNTGPLELCVNDSVFSDNAGAWGVGVTVDESNAR
jgi:hypothetical protein